jgi:sarcosine oxidase
VSPSGTAGTAADLVVVGAGTMGAWTAFRARRAGWATTLVDAYGAGHPRATSGDETRIIRASHGDDLLYTRWSREARDAWRSFSQEIGEPLMIEAGALWFAHHEDGFEAASIATLTAEGIPVERVAPAEVSARWPQIAADDLAFATYEPEAGLLMARRGVAAVARRFSAEGGRFELAWAAPGRIDGRRLADIELGDGRRIAAGQFVFAAGPWLPRIFPDILGDLIRVTKQDVVFMGPTAGDGRFAAEWLPSWVDYDAAFYGIPAVDGRGMKLAPDRYGPIFDPSHGERIVDPESVRLARRYLARRFPALADAPVVETRVCQYETTPDTHFIIDRHPAFDNVWIVGGGSGHGFKHGPVIGRYMVDRLSGAPASADERRFGLGHTRVPRPNMRTGADGMIEGWADW